MHVSCEYGGDNYIQGNLVLCIQSTTDPNQFTHHEVTQFHILNWNVQGKCSEVLTITNVIEEMYRVQRRTGNNPVVVHCRLVVLLCWWSVWQCQCAGSISF